MKIYSASPQQVKCHNRVVTGTRCYTFHTREIQEKRWIAGIFFMCFKKNIRNISSSWLRIKPHICRSACGIQNVRFKWHFHIVTLRPEGFNSLCFLSSSHTPKCYFVELMHSRWMNSDFMSKWVWVWFSRYTLASLLLQHKTLKNVLVASIFLFWNSHFFSRVFYSVLADERNWHI